MVNCICKTEFEVHTCTRPCKQLSNNKIEVELSPDFVEASIITKPPIGLTPKWLWIEQRRNEIVKAMGRYKEAGLPIPKKWTKELHQHQTTINQRKNRKVK